MVETVKIAGEAILRDYPLRLWLQQQEHTDAVMREFQLLLGAQEVGSDLSPPQQLIDLAEMFTNRFGALISEINAERHAALAEGRDRMDSRVPMPEGTPQLLDQVATVFTAVDDYCQAGELLTLARPPELIAFFEWTRSELTAQYEGAAPTPWPGPF